MGGGGAGTVNLTLTDPGRAGLVGMRICRTYWGALYNRAGPTLIELTGSRSSLLVVMVTAGAGWPGLTLLRILAVKPWLWLRQPPSVINSHMSDGGRGDGAAAAMVGAATAARVAV